MAKIRCSHYDCTSTPKSNRLWVDGSGWAGWLGVGVWMCPGEWASEFVEVSLPLALWATSSQIPSDPVNITPKQAAFPSKAFALPRGAPIQDMLIQHASSWSASERYIPDQLFDDVVCLSNCWCCPVFCFHCFACFRECESFATFFTGIRLLHFADQNFQPLRSKAWRPGTCQDQATASKVKPVRDTSHYSNCSLL